MNARRSWSSGTERRIDRLSRRGQEAWDTSDGSEWRRTYNEAQALYETASEQEFASRAVDDPEHLRVLFAGGIHDARSIVTMGSYGLVHADLAHLAMNLVGVAVLGKVLEPRIGGRRLLLLLLIGTAAGAAVHAAIDHGYLIGISAGVGALYGTALPAARNGRFGAFDRLIVLLAMLFVLVSLAGLLLPIMPGVAHAAHLGGFLAGLLLSHRLLP